MTRHDDFVRLRHMLDYARELDFEIAWYMAMMPWTWIFSGMSSNMTFRL